MSEYVCRVCDKAFTLQDKKGYRIVCSKKCWAIDKKKYHQKHYRLYGVGKQKTSKQEKDEALQDAIDLGFVSDFNWNDTHLGRHKQN